MKQLNRIVLVNWYVLGAVEVPIKGNVAIVGPNGSGKSSLLDAIQTILMGGHKRNLSFNASGMFHLPTGRYAYWMRRRKKNRALDRA